MSARQLSLGRTVGASAKQLLHDIAVKAHQLGLVKMEHKASPPARSDVQALRAKLSEEHAHFQQRLDDCELFGMDTAGYEDVVRHHARRVRDIIDECFPWRAGAPGA